MKRLGVLVLILAVGGAAQGLRFWGTWDMTLELLPTLRIYGSNLILNCSFAPGWRIESESKIYAGGVYKYQNFYVSGRFGDFSVWGKMYFSAEEVRYQKVWLNAEIPVFGGTFRSSFNHWASAKDYTSTDAEMFGAWPCAEVVSWDEAWKFIGRTMCVTGPVAGYYEYSGGSVAIYLGKNYPDLSRFQIYIGASKVPDFETKFGEKFWRQWVGKEVCVCGEIVNYIHRDSQGRPDYSVVEIELETPQNLSLGSCSGIAVSSICPHGVVIPWYKAANYNVNDMLYVQGPIAEFYASNTIMRLGAGYPYWRVEVVTQTNKVFDTNTWTLGKEVCVYGKVIAKTSYYVRIQIGDNFQGLSRGPCCTGMFLPGVFLNWRFRYTLAPWTFTLDFGDCCTGFSFRKLQVDVTGLPLCCGLFFDASLSFTKSGFDKIAFTLGDLSLCCGVTTKIAAEFTPTGKRVELKPSWRGLSGCFTIYGDALFTGSTWQGIEVWGFMVNCYFPTCGYLRILTAFDPAKFWIDDNRNITASRTQPSYYSALFRTGEFEYMSAKFCMAGCCGGEVSFILEGWFGSGTYLFGFRRFKFDFQVPITASITLFSKAQWDFSKVSPLEWFDVGWSLSF